MCHGRRLQEIGSEADFARVGDFHFTDESLAFEANVWSADDSPNFPSGGVVKGRLRIEETEDRRAVLRVDSCRHIPPEQ